MRLQGALLWETDGKPHRDEIVVSDEHQNGSDSHVVILDRGGQPRAASPQELPAGSVLLLPHDVSDRDVDRIQHSGYAARRATERVLDADTRVNGDFSEADIPEEHEPDGESRRAAIVAAEAELDEVIERLRRELRQRHPDLFDARGRLRRGAFARKMRERSGGRSKLTREEIIELTGGSLAPADGSSSTNAP